MENKSYLKPIILGGSIFLGLFLLGNFIFKGLKTFSDNDRVVTVKGLAEMNLIATSATISINFSFSGDNLVKLIKQSDDKKNSIIDYLITIGYNKNDIKINTIGIEDKQRYYDKVWRNNQQVQEKIDRYISNQSLTFQTKDVKVTEDLSSKIELELTRKDLSSTFHTNYIFPELNSIKPQLIAQSTQNARVAGEQFANDSKAQLGKIKKASQGQITLSGKYINYEEDYGDAPVEKPKEPYIQKARVVSTIVFFLD